MASGFINLPTNDSRLAARISWSSSISNGANLLSSFTVTIQAKRTDSYTTTGTWDWGYSLLDSDGFRIGDKDYYYGSKYAAISSNWVNLGTGTYTVAHQIDGTATVTFGSADVGAPTGTSMEGRYAELMQMTTVKLDTILGKATIVSAPNFNDEENPTITYKNPNGNAVTKLQACISWTGATDDISYRDIPKTGTSYTFQLTDAERKKLRQMASSPSQSIKFYVKTVLGNTNYHSSLTKTFTIINGTPTFSHKIVDINSETLALTKDEDILVRGHSNAVVNTGAVARKEATIKAQSIKCGNQLYLGGAATVTKVPSNRFEFAVEDSRGARASLVISKTWVEYVDVTCNMDAKLEFSSETTAKATLSIKGNYFIGKFGSADNALTNNLRVMYRYKEGYGDYSEWLWASLDSVTGGTYSATAVIEDLDYQGSYTFQAMANDLLTSAESQEEKLKLLPVFDWGENDFSFNVPINFPNDGGIGIRGTTTDGQLITALQPCNGNNNLVLGWGGYDAEIGATNIYGNAVNIESVNDVTINGKIYGENQVLWSGAFYMTDTHTITLNTPVSEQAHGIILVFSRYANGNVQDHNFNCFFVPKGEVAMQEGNGHTFFMVAGSKAEIAAVKILYIYDDRIVGNADNDNGATTGASGITCTNSAFVLRYVIGV